MDFKEQLQHKIDFKTKPLGSLGQLERIALQVGNIQQTLSPKISNPAMLVFAADHGLVDEKVSPCPKEITWQMALNFMRGGAAISVFCKQNGFELKVIDAGVDYDFAPGGLVIDAKIARGTRNMMHEPAMTTEECQRALDKGGEFVQGEVANGCNTVGFGEMGIGNTSPSSLLMHRFMNRPIEECTGAGAGMFGDDLDHKTKVLKAVSEKYDPQTPLETLATFGGLEIAMMTGGMLEAYKHGMIILVDGFIATAALLAACAMEPKVRENCIFCHSSQEKGHVAMLEHFNAEPVLQLGLRLGEGTGAALALPIIQSAVNFVNQMASFEEAGVAEVA